MTRIRSLRSAGARHVRVVLLALAFAGASAFAAASFAHLDARGVVWGAVVGVVLCAMLSSIVTIHEMAHLVTGRLLGVRSDAFSVGFGPEILGATRGGVRWSWRVVPLGGYVRLVGESDPAVPGGLAAAGTLRTSLVYLAGPVANVGTAALAAAGLAVARGVDPARIPEAVAAILWYALEITGRLFAEWIPSMASNLAAMPFGGIPSMFVAFDQALRSGPFLMTVLFILLNLSIGLMNLLPIPPLDGGQAALSLARARLGDRLPEAAVRRAVRVGFAGLLVFMLAVNVIDLLRWTLGGYTPGA